MENTNKAIVYVVSCGEYDDYQIHAMFSTRELAESWISTAGEVTYGYKYEIEEWELDEQVGWTEQILYQTCLWADTGELINRHGERKEVVAQGLEEATIEDETCRPYALGRSVISQERADELAREAMDKWAIR